MAFLQGYPYVYERDKGLTVSGKIDDLGSYTGVALSS